MSSPRIADSESPTAMLRCGIPAFKHAFSGNRGSSQPVSTTACARHNSSSSPSPGLARFEVRTIDYDYVKVRLRETVSHVHFIDVREPHEFEQGSIPSAKNIPLGLWKDALPLDPPDFKQKTGFDKPRECHELVIYCRSGKRAAVACEVAFKSGYKNVLNYLGSWQDWSQREAQQESTNVY